MSIAKSLLAEFEEQAPVTQKFLERLPDNKLTWQPHHKSLTAGQLAFHIAAVPGGIIRAAQSDSIPVPDFNFPQPTSVQDVLKVYADSIAAVRALLPSFDDAAMQATWRMMAGDQEVMAVPRVQLVRNIMLNHWYQHRGQFGVYLRLLDIPVPSSWGPSADEKPAFMPQLQSA